jgi:hypothetical protein
MPGYRATVALDRSRRDGAVVLASSDEIDTDVLAFRALRDLALGPDDADMTIAALPANATPADVRFDGLDLVGWSVPATVPRGSTFDMTLYFRVMNTMTGDWEIFVHGDAPNAKHRIHADHFPLVPTTLWQKGQLIRDRVTVRVPSDYDADAFTVWLGFYEGMRRMPIASTSGHDGKSRARGPTIAVGSTAP